MPTWRAEPDHAGRLHTDYFTLLWMLEYGGFSQRYEWFLQAWAIEAEHAPGRQATAEADAEDARMAAAGWRGGRVDPTEQCTFDDEGEVA